MSGCRSFEIRELAFNPDVDETPFEEFADLKAELGYGVDLALKFGVFHLRSIDYPQDGSTAQVVAGRE